MQKNIKIFLQRLECVCVCLYKSVMGLCGGVCTRGCRGGRRPPEILIVRRASAQTVGAAQRGLRGEISSVGQAEVRGEAVPVHRHVGIILKLICFREVTGRSAVSILTKGSNTILMFLNSLHNCNLLKCVTINLSLV